MSTQHICKLRCFGKAGLLMKRAVCLFLALVFVLSLGVSALADNDILYCRMCGRQIPADSRVCPYCGVAVVLAEDSASPKTEAPKDDGVSVAQSAASPVSGPFNTTIVGANTPGNVRVTKSPTSESVPYGGSCLFIAHASNATSVTWYIANGDASIVLTAAEAANNISGLSVSGANSDTLSLSGIPSWMNGYQVQACFTGEGGPVYSGIARIWTYEQPVEKECNYPWWWWYYWYVYPDPYDPPLPPDPGGDEGEPDISGESITPGESTIFDDNLPDMDGGSFSF